MNAGRFDGNGWSAQDRHAGMDNSSTPDGGVHHSRSITTTLKALATLRSVSLSSAFCLSLTPLCASTLYRLAVRVPFFIQDNLDLWSLEGH